MEDVLLEWGDAKRESNLAKHGIDFGSLFSFFQNPQRLEWSDDRHDEERTVSIGPRESVMLCVVYTEREQAMRVISARPATRAERKAYDREIFGE